MDSILIVSEDERASGFLGMVLQREHFLPILASSREAAVHNICTLHPDILMIDVPMAGTGSVELCMELAACHDKGHIIVLGDSSDEMDKVLALEAGADDYIVKPFAPRELVARVRALLRRRRANAAPVIHFGNMEVDRERRIVTSHGEQVMMSP
ncbi:MAG: response regulator transcription factor, partial [Acidobacteriaceae bacterium]|nr:response regulator transcription factor [Acidobacteriaceae bacterium]